MERSHGAHGSSLDRLLAGGALVVALTGHKGADRNLALRVGVDRQDPITRNHCAPLADGGLAHAKVAGCLERTTWHLVKPFRKREFFHGANFSFN